MLVVVSHPNEITDMSEMGARQGVGPGRERGRLCQFRCRILHVWVSFPPGPALCNHCSVLHTYWKARLCFQEIRLNRGHQSLKAGGGRAPFR